MPVHIQIENSIILRKWLIIPIIAALIVPAFSRHPAPAMGGAAWDRSREMLGTVLGAEAPGDGFTRLNNDTAPLLQAIEKARAEAEEAAKLPPQNSKFHFFDTFS